jgi:hypothetical protein
MSITAADRRGRASKRFNQESCSHVAPALLPLPAHAAGKSIKVGIISGEDEDVSVKGISKGKQRQA